MTRLYWAAAKSLRSLEQAARASYIAASPRQRTVYLGASAVLSGLVLAMLIILVSNTAKPPVEDLDKSIPHDLAASNNNVATTAPPVAPALVVEAPAPAQKKVIRQKKIQPAEKKLARTRSLEETTAINSGAPALVSISVLPWGEVYLDGRMQGVSPPLAELQVVPGKHEIEIRNTSFPVYKKLFLVKSGGVLKIRHKFGG